MELLVGLHLDLTFEFVSRRDSSALNHFGDCRVPLIAIAASRLLRRSASLRAESPADGSHPRWPFR